MRIENFFKKCDKLSKNRVINNLTLYNRNSLSEIINYKENKLFKKLDQTCFTKFKQSLNNIKKNNFNFFINKLKKYQIKIIKQEVVKDYIRKKSNSINKFLNRNKKGKLILFLNYNLKKTKEKIKNNPKKKIKIFKRKLNYNSNEKLNNKIDNNLVVKFNNNSVDKFNNKNSIKKLDKNLIENFNYNTDRIKNLKKKYSWDKKKEARSIKKDIEKNILLNKKYCKKLKNKSNLEFVLSNFQNKSNLSYSKNEKKYIFNKFI